MRAALQSIRAPGLKRDPVRDGYIVAAVFWCLLIAFGVVEGASDGRGWWALRLPDPYLVKDYSLLYGFWFTPPIAFAFYPFTLLPLSLFAAAWTGVMFLALGLMVGRWSALALLIPVVWWEIYAGNIALLIGLAVVAGFSHPATWSFVLLTKITPGIGLLWFVFRREWRSLWIALLTTAVIAAVCLLVAPNLWAEWFDRLSSNVGNDGPGYFTVPIPLTVRLVMAAAIVAWGARTNRRWTVIVAATLGTPVLWFNSLATLVAIIPLMRHPSATATIRESPHVPSTASSEHPRT